MTITRRHFLHNTLGSPALLSLGGIVPALWSSAIADSSQADPERVLVVVQLSGGNDGLNTVIPFRHDAYQKGRPKLAIPQSDVLKIEGELGLHPSLRGFSDLLDAGRLSIVQGVGYDNPNRSHFESMDIWHTCHLKEKRTHPATGWLGRWADKSSGRIPEAGPASGTTTSSSDTSKSHDIAAMHIGHEKLPLALSSKAIQVPSVSSLDQFRLEGRPETASTIRELAASERASANDLLGFVQSSTASAIEVSDRIKQAAKAYAPKQSYPDSDLGRKLKLTAQLIDAGFSARVYYVELDGFDTHAQQPAAHAGLLRQLSEAVTAFTNDMAAQGHGQRVLTFCFSEFGRRLQENASEGTDHGAAAPVFLAGEAVAKPILGEHPSLTDLQEGDLKHHTDFRQIYATLLEKWLKVPSHPIIGQQFELLPLLAQGKF